MDADQALLAEIDENLVRADLTPSERAAHHAKRKQLYLKLHPETQKGKAGSRTPPSATRRSPFTHRASHCANMTCAPTNSNVAIAINFIL
jgi:hypothetical protein